MSAPDLSAEDLADRVARFNQRDEIFWFGLQGEVEGNGEACIRFSRLEAGFLGGGGVQAVNGGVITAGFDAACVLAAWVQYDAAVVVTLALNVQFLRLAHASQHLVFKARVAKRGAQVCFVTAELVDAGAPSRGPLALAQATLAPLVTGTAPAR